MEICVESFDGEKYTVEVGVDDTTADIRRKVASAAELCEDGFDMSFGGKLLAEGDDTTQLSAGDTVVLTKTKSQKDDAIAALHDLGETALTSERFKRLTEPKLIRLFLQAEVVTEIPNYFLWNNVTHSRPYFVSHCSALQTLDLSGWNNVTTVGSCFLSNCSALTTLDLSGWNNVTQVGRHFLFNCTSLTTLDLSGWNNVTQIHPHFLEGCNIRTSSINVTGSSSVVTKYVHSRKVKHKTKHKCVCM